MRLSHEFLFGFRCSKNVVATLSYFKRALLIRNLRLKKTFLFSFFLDLIDGGSLIEESKNPI